MYHESISILLPSVDLLDKSLQELKLRLVHHEMVLIFFRISFKVLRNGSSHRDVAADTDAADGPHGLGMQCHCTGVMPTGRACSDRPGFAKFARVTEMLVVPDENCGVVPRMSGASGSPVTPTFLAGSIN